MGRVGMVLRLSFLFFRETNHVRPDSFVHDLCVCGLGGWRGGGWWWWRRGGGGGVGGGGGSLVRMRLDFSFSFLFACLFLFSV